MIMYVRSGLIGRSILLVYRPHTQHKSPTHPPTHPHTSPRSGGWHPPARSSPPGALRPPPRPSPASQGRAPPGLASCSGGGRPVLSAGVGVLAVLIVGGYVTQTPTTVHTVGKTHRVLDHEVPRLPPPADRLPTGLLLNHPLPQRRGAGGRRIVSGGGGALLCECGCGRVLGGGMDGYNYIYMYYTTDT